jgi:hypothetical protein
MGRRSKQGAGADRGVAPVKEGFFDTINSLAETANDIADWLAPPIPGGVYNPLTGRGGNSGGSFNNAGPIQYSGTSANNMSKLQEAGYERATQLLYDNPELRDPTTVMLPSGQIEARPNPDISVSEARSRVANDILAGRRANAYEQGLATGAILSREEQALAQRALRNAIGQGFITSGSFDTIPQVPMDLLRRAAGVTPNVSGEVKLKAKSFQNTQPKPGQPGQPGQPNRPGQPQNSSGFFRRGDAAKQWLNRKFSPTDSEPRGAINAAIKSSPNKDALINRLTTDPATKIMSRAEAEQFVATLETNS